MMAAPRLPGKQRRPPRPIPDTDGLPPPFRWKSNDGRTTALHDMDSVHIERCIALMQRRSVAGATSQSLQKTEQDIFWIELMAKELELRRQVQMRNLARAAGRA
jgi:hypothetical protein